MGEQQPEGLRPALVFAAQSPYPGRQNFLIVAQATSKQPERYTQCGPKLYQNIWINSIDK
jgi:hypothetical protein